MVYIKRVYAPAAEGDGTRFLVDRLWPRGVKKEAAHVASWAKEVAPSDALRAWYHQDPAMWREFQRRYFAELDHKPETWQPLLTAARQGDITLVFSARDTELNNAVALKAYLEKRLKKPLKKGLPN
jgi:uncharacterized protein YeaO (DUF488 family)